MSSRFLAPLTRIPQGDPLLDLHREMNRMFEDVFKLGSFGSGTLLGNMMSSPRLEVCETEQELCISAELPGVKPSEVDVRLDGDTLTITGEKKSEQDQDRQNMHVNERSYGRFQRSVQLPFTPDPEEVQADFEHGVLTVRLQRRSEAQRSRRIEVREAGNGAQSRQLSRRSDAPESSDETGYGSRGSSDNKSRETQGSEAADAAH